MVLMAPHADLYSQRNRQNGNDAVDEVDPAFGPNRSMTTLDQSPEAQVFTYPQQFEPNSYLDDAGADQSEL